MFRKRLVKALSFGMALCFTLSFHGLAAQNLYGSNPHNQNQQANGNGKQHKSASEYMTGQNFMRGDGNRNYNLSGLIIRGDMMIMLVRAFNLHSNAGEEILMIWFQEIIIMMRWAPLGTWVLQRATANALCPASM